MHSSTVGTYRLTFLLPRGLSLPVGRHAPAEDACCLVIRPGGVAEVAGRSRETVFDHAGLLLRVIRRRTPIGKAPAIVAMTLETPTPQGPRKDLWTAIVGAEVAFSPTGLDPVIPAGGSGPGPPRLKLIAGRRAGTKR